jgi:hypothetical protein
MACPSWLNRGFALGAVFGVLVGGGAAVAWFTLRASQHDSVRDDQPIEIKTEEDRRRLENHPVYRFLEDGKKAKAQLVCKALANACEAYQTDPQNQNLLPPQRLTDLLDLPDRRFAYVKGGFGAIVDPWGKEYQLELLKHSDGSVGALIKTAAPDGTPISQFGIGDAAKPKE